MGSAPNSQFAPSWYAAFEGSHTQGREQRMRALCGQGPAPALATPAWRLISSSTNSMRSLPQKSSSPTMIMGTPNTSRSRPRLVSSASSAAPSSDAAKASKASGSMPSSRAIGRRPAYSAMLASPCSQ
mgnify:CR=1 FL=1